MDNQLVDGETFDWLVRFLGVGRCGQVWVGMGGWVTGCRCRCGWVQHKAFKRLGLANFDCSVP